jgi:cytidylate kinase
MSSNVIAIDGPAGSGKSSVAKAVADRLSWSFLDTGAMYRAITCEVLFEGREISQETDVVAVARSADLHTLPRVVINGRDVTEEIRTDEVNRAVSVVAAMPLVRAELVGRQRAFAESQPRGTVVEGRDIASVVFPDATVKVYLTASLEERSRRRGEEGIDSIARRDEADSTRKASPLLRSSDAVEIDTTGLTIDQVVEEVLRCLPKN